MENKISLPAKKGRPQKRDNQKDDSIYLLLNKYANGGGVDRAGRDAIIPEECKGPIQISSKPCPTSDSMGCISMSLRNILTS